VNVRLLMVAAALGALAPPAAARAQTERLAGRVEARTRAAVEALVDSARAAGLPGGPLVNKALEGASKGADGARIVAAVRTLSRNLARARSALGSASAEAELVAGAAALQAGVEASFLELLRAERRREPVVVSLAVMADLVANGVPPDTAAQAVLALARVGTREAELVAFRQSVERDVALGAPAGAAASLRLNEGARQAFVDQANTFAPANRTPRKP